MEAVSFLIWDPGRSSNRINSVDQLVFMLWTEQIWENNITSGFRNRALLNMVYWVSSLSFSSIKRKRTKGVSIWSPSGVKHTPYFTSLIHSLLSEPVPKARLRRPNPFHDRPKKPKKPKKPKTLYLLIPISESPCSSVGFIYETLICGGSRRLALFV